MRITKEYLENLIKEAASEYVWGVKGPARVANQYKVSTLKKIIKEELDSVLREKELSDEDESELDTIKKELEGASKMHKGQADRIGNVVNEEEKCWDGYGPGAKSGVKTKTGKSGKRVNNCEPINEEEFYEVEALDENEEYCPECAKMEEDKKKACKPSKGKRFAKRVDGKCRSYGQAGQAKGGGDRIRPGTKKGDAYCARSAGIKKCKNPPCANTLSRKKWKCRGKKSMKS
jgi:hypothetical protein